MPPKIQPVYYRDRKGNEPVSDFIDALQPRDQATIDNQIGRIRDLCSPAHPDLPFPHSSSIDGPLRELRCHAGRAHFRILYRRSGNLLILLHMIRKASASVPDSDIKLATSRWDDFKQRMDAKPRRPPRAAGHDAP